MRGHLVAIAIGTTLTATAARAQCQDQDGGSDCQPVRSVAVSPLPSITAAPLLDIDAVVQDHGAAFVHNPNASVLVTVRGSGADGGGLIPSPDGGVDSTGAPLVSALSFVGFEKDKGVFTVTFDGGTPLFLGDNTVTVSAVRPGVQIVSAPQLVRFDPSFNGGGSDGGAASDGGVPSDGGTGVSDGGTSGGDGGTGGGTLPDGGVRSSGATLVIAAGDSGGCSTTSSGPPSFFLMALTVMLAALGRRGMRS